MTGRSVEEWIGKTPDSAIPDRVRRRVFDAYDGRCYLSGVEIQPGDIWHIEHIKALCNGGENRESNLAPALVEPHREKTSRDRAEKDKTERMRRKHLGIKDPNRKIMPGSKRSRLKQRLGKRGREAWERRA